ncbi:class I SAM-dependent methyltransferase [Pontixanthobacter aquaemixtae]|uniref:Methyltransferase domain-containing protein n=1 Tax=Pontixanthobacter aquaemixtae TaxID=1958940 RepID=A0A844ZPK6_9SPHN|nr:class I SAM-dependent methyltransferase [Pontixanthobacter aquaemixtae]MXO89678.1 methyltransferase domain-containing protein [Pontixanthobacter aquaemixtae]
MSAPSHHNKTGNPERPSNFYDRKFLAVDHRSAHYTQSPYFPMWAVIADRISREGFENILDIGCGPGQFAAMLFDQGVPSYTGLDFSLVATVKGQKACPDYSFICADIRADNSLEDGNYDCVVMLEFLEHVEDEIDVLRRIKPGATLLGSVPNFPAFSHVRHFKNCDEVTERYAKLFQSFTVREMMWKDYGSKFFVIQAVM